MQAMKFNKFHRGVPRAAHVWVLMLLLLIAFLAAGCSPGYRAPDIERILEITDSQCRSAGILSRKCLY